MRRSSPRSAGVSSAMVGSGILPGSITRRKRVGDWRDARACGPPGGHRRPVGPPPRRGHGPGCRRGRVADHGRGVRGVAHPARRRAGDRRRDRRARRSPTSPARGGDRGARRVPRGAAAGRRRGGRPVRPAGLGPRGPRRGGGHPVGRDRQLRRHRPSDRRARGRPGPSVGRSAGTRSACSSRVTGSSPPTARSAATAATPGAASRTASRSSATCCCAKGSRSASTTARLGPRPPPGDSHLEVR